MKIAYLVAIARRSLRAPAQKLLSWHVLRRMLLTLITAQLAIIGLLIAARKIRGAQRKDVTAPPIPPPVSINGTVAQIYPDGPTLYRTMLTAMAQARESVYFETFLWTEDSIGWEFKEQLIERARAGVQVYIIYDWLVNILRSPAFTHFPELPTLHALPYRSIRQPRHLFDPRRFGRDHRKILVIDEQTAFVGGFNIGSHYGQWRDTHVCLQGTAAADLAYTFADLWNRECGPESTIRLPTRAWIPDIRVHLNDRLRLTMPIYGVYLDAIERAQRRILITQAYFVPDRLILQALIRAAERGVDVQILLPWHSNHPTADWLSRSRFGPLLHSGARIFGYMGPVLHAKTATIDGIWTMIGTANLDRLSLAGNNEINVEVFSADLARQMEAIFAHDLATACEVRRDAWDARPWYQRAAETILAPLWPLA
jgi:cardiolipin synthase